MTIDEAALRIDPALYAEVAPLLARFRRTHSSDSDDLIAKAYHISHRAHEGQFRKSGEPYITHPLAVAMNLADLGLDLPTIVAALLHDTVEDTEMTLEEIESEFGEEVRFLIDGVTKLDKIHFDSRETAQAASIRKMVVAMAQDIRVLLIKLADRLHNLRTIDPLPEAKQQRIAAETLEVYAPLAHRLGVQEIKHELENRCFKILYPKRNAEIDDLIAVRAPQRQAIIDKSIGEVFGVLSDAGIEADVSGRPKHNYSIYRKMISTGQAFDQIYDLIGIRILVETVRDCYAALGLIHTLWPPLDGRFKDYIARPKFNLYQSLHTTVIGPDGKPLEVQIRTHEMHHRSEYGVAAHWRYKEDGGTDLPWISDLRFLQDEYADPQEFLTNLKLDLYQDEVFVVTPRGDVVTLPQGSTPIDFAYNIHTEIGDHCSGAKVNSRLVPLDTVLKSGDIVEILTSNASRPSRDWLRFVSSHRARAKIKQFFSRQRREEALGTGKDRVLERLRKAGLGLGKERDALLTEAADLLGYRSLESLYIAVGEGTLSPANVVTRLERLIDTDEVPTDQDTDLLAPPVSRTYRSDETGIIVEGLDDVWVRIAQCCAPVPGDDIVGFVTVGRGVSAHRSDCVNVANLPRNRMIEVSWAPDRAVTFAVWIQVEALDRSGLLRDVTATITDLGGNILASSSATRRDRVAVLRYEVELADTSQVAKMVSLLGSVDGVFDAFRIMPHGGKDSS